MKERVTFEREINLLSEQESTAGQRPVPPVAQLGPDPCSKQKLSKIVKDKPTIDITGRYYTRAPLITYVINQAGLHFECIASFVLSGLPPHSQKIGAHRPISEIHGDLRGDGKFYWFNRTQPGQNGTIRENRGRLFISNSSEDKEYELLQMEKRPTLMGSAHKILLSERDLDLVERYELAPLTPGQRYLIKVILDKYTLEKIFKLYFDTQKQEEALGSLWTRLKERRTPAHPNYAPSTKFDRFHDVDMPLARLYARQLLTTQKWTLGQTTRSHIDWIQIMMDTSWEKGFLKRHSGVETDLQRFLGIRISPKDARGDHKYKFTFSLTGGGLILGGFTGRVLIQKISGRKWKKEFNIDLGGGIVPLDIKIGDEFEGAANSYIEWTENDIPGTVRMAMVEGSIALGFASAQAGFMHVLGNGSLPPLDVFFQNAKVGVPNIEKISQELAKGEISGRIAEKRGYPAEGISKKMLGLDVTANVLFGSIGPTFAEIFKRARKGPTDLDLSKEWKSDISVSRISSSEVHYCLGDDRLTDAGRQTLRIMCARELASLVTPETYLIVVGHADTLAKDKPDLNKKLSGRRANGAVKAIVDDILGAKFNVKSDNIKVIALGHLLALWESQGKVVASPKHRRVQIFINSTQVLTLFGQTKP